MLLAHRCSLPGIPGTARRRVLPVDGRARALYRKPQIPDRAALCRIRPQLRMIEKLIEVYIGVTVIASLIFALIVSVAG